MEGPPTYFIYSITDSTLVILSLDSVNYKEKEERKSLLCEWKSVQSSEWTEGLSGSMDDSFS